MGWFLAPKLKTLRDKMDILSAKEADVRKELENDEMHPGKKRKKEVDNWLDAIKTRRTEVESIEKDCKSNWKRLLVANVDSVTKEIQDLIQQHGDFRDRLVLFDPKSKEVEFIPEKLFGKMLQQNTEQILKWTEEPLICSIGVHGMGGVGKTTLLRHIFNQLHSKCNTTGGRVHWVTASKDCNLYTLQKKIAKAIGVELKKGEKDNKRRAALLQHCLQQMGNVVLFLDDVWERYEVNSIGIPYGTNGCKTILSTRSIEVCRSMGCKNSVIRVKTLQESEAWELFVSKLGNYEELAPEVQAIATLVAKECACLPLAVIAIGSSMKEVSDMREWKNALDELRNPDRGQEDMEEKVLQILKFSYDRLNNDILRYCFLSCILYPEVDVINREDLIELWIMEGLLDDVGSMSEQLNKGHAILNKLINLCLLEAGSPLRVKMHDLMRDMAIRITQRGPYRFMANSRLQLQKVPAKKRWIKSLVKVSLSYNFIEEIPFGMAPLTPHLTVLILKSNPLKKIPESFFEHMRALKVLDLSDTDIERLPESFSKLENLRVLLLMRCRMLVYVPPLEKLTKLKVLNFENCGNLTYVPSVEKLTELMVLDCDPGFIKATNHRFVEAPKGIERLKCLEKVKNFRWDKSDITGFNKLIQSSPSLNCYKFWLQLSIDLNQYYAFGALNKIYLYDKAVLLTGLGLEDEETSYLLPTTIKMLGLVDCDMEGRRLGDVFPTLARATDLQGMLIQNCPGLINLELGGWSSYLRKLTIIGCPGLKVVIPFAQYLCLPNLESLLVRYCVELEEIFESNNGNQPNPFLSVPKLKYLSLDNLPKLNSIYRGALICISIPDVEICACPKVKLFRSSSSSAVLIDVSQLTLASVTGNPEVWQMLECDYAQDADDIRHHINGVSDEDSDKRVTRVSDDESDETDMTTDSLKLNMTAVDQVYPLLSDLSTSLNKLSILPPDFEKKTKMKEWLGRLSKMGAADELTEQQARQLHFDLESSYNSFMAALPQAGT